MIENKHIENKERITQDLDLVEQLGSGILRILEIYPKESFVFSENFLRVVLPSAERNNRGQDKTDGLVDGLVGSSRSDHWEIVRENYPLFTIHYSLFTIH